MIALLYGMCYILSVRVDFIQGAQSAGTVQA